MKRNLYIALLFSSAPGLHLTVRYYKGMDADQERELIQRVQRWCGAMNPRQHVISLGPVEMFGPRCNVRVLRATDLPPWIEALRTLVEPTTPDTYGFKAHVTTPNLDPCKVAMTAVAVMHKDQVLFLWDCQ